MPSAASPVRANRSGMELGGTPNFSITPVRRTNGGCDQGQALDALGELAAEFGQTVRNIRALPSGPLVRGMGDLLIQAAETEQAAVVSLRETWRSLDPSSFDRYSAERTFAGALRRQAAVELQDLLALQGIAPGG